MNLNSLPLTDREGLAEEFIRLMEDRSPFRNKADVVCLNCFKLADIYPDVIADPDNGLKYIATMTDCGCRSVKYATFE